MAIYDKNTDYQKLIDQAVAEGNLALAALYEQQRNAKITGEGLPYETTNLYGQHLGGKPFENPYSQMLNETLAGLGGSFQYDPEQDEAYGAYRRQYLREADRTMQDTLGQYAVQTGGIPTAQAVAAASQAADNYKAKAADAIPEMRAQAYSEWLNQQNLGLNNAQLLMSAASQEESSYQNQMTMAMNRWAALGYADEQVAGMLGVPVGTPTTDQSYQNWAMAQQEKSDAYSMAMSMLQSYIMPSDEMLAAAGISKDDAQKLYDAYAPQVSGGGSGGGGGGSSGKVPSYDDQIWNQLMVMYESGKEEQVNYWLSRLSADGYDVGTIMSIISGYGTPRNNNPANLPVQQYTK